MWFTELNTSKVGRMTLSGMVTVEYATLTFNTGGDIRLATGPDGNLWYTTYNANKIGRVTTSGAITEFAAPGSGGPNGITKGPDGNIWVLENVANQVIKMSPSGAVLGQFPIPTAGAGPTDITTGSDGNLWFTEIFVDKVARISTAGTVTEYPVPTASAQPAGITSGPDGNIWFTENAVSKIGKVTPSGVFTEYVIPTAASSPSSITPGADGNLWFTEAATNQVASITTSGTVTEFAVPTSASKPTGIRNGPDNNIWFTEFNGNKLAHSNPGPTTPITSADTNAGGSPSERFGCACHKERVQPVDTATGAFYHTFTDLAIPGRGLALDFTRTYNSTQAAITGPLGKGWTDSYAISLSVDSVTGNVTITEEGGSSVTFTASGSTYTAPSRVMATLVKNADGTFTFTRTVARMTFAFSVAGQLRSETDRNGYATTFSYNASGQLATITDPAGRTLTLSYTGSNVTKLTDVSGRTVTYAYKDGLGNLTDVTDVNGGTWHFTYDTNHLLLTMTDPRGQVTTNVYDTSNRVTSQTQTVVASDRTKDRTTTFSYSGDPTSAASSTTIVTDPKGNKVADQYSLGERIATTAGYGTSQAATWTYAYDPATLALTAVTDPNGHTTAMTYDTSGNLLSSINALGRATSATYDSFSDLLTSTDGLGVTTTRTYDSNGNLLSVSTPLVGSSPAQNQVTSYAYGDAAHPGDVTAVTDPDGKVSHLAYDSDGDLSSTTDPLSEQTTTTYNNLGWPLSRVSPRGNVAGCTCAAQYTTSFSYADPATGAVDEFGDVRVTTDPLGGKVVKSYDADRNLVSIKDADGNLTQYTVDLANEQTDVTRADGTKLHTDFYPDGSVQDQINGAGNTTSYLYDPLGHLTSLTDPLNNVTTYASDTVGNLLTKADPGGSCTATPKVGCTTDTYDAANEVTAITYSDGVTPNVTGLTYDADGQRTAMTDGTGTSRWVWDSLHRMTSYTNGNSAAVSFSYNLRSLETAITYPGNLTVTQGYDDTGRMTSVTDWLGNVTSIGYDPDSDLTSETFAKGDVDTFAFDAAGRMSTISDVKHSTSLFAATYARDAAGQITGDTSAAATQSAYRYSALNQVCYAGSANSAACSSPPVASQPFSYDAADNLTLIGSTQQAFNAGSEVCWTAATAGTCASPPVGATTYTYDARGNRTKVAPAGAAATTLTYDQTSRLTAYGSAATYTYNGDGLRMSKTLAGASATQHVWNVSTGLPVLLQDGTTSYVYGPGGLPVEQVTSAGVLYFHHDQLGSTRLLTTTAGTPAATYSYDPYGNLIASSGTVTNPVLYAGQYRDAESGFQYSRARYYDPATGQFLTRDPLVASTRSPYAYVSGNPLTMKDPSGLEQINTVPSTYQGETATCWVAESSGYNDYIVVNPAGDNDVQVCGDVFPSGNAVAQSQLKACVAGCWGGNGEYTGGVNYPAEVNGGAYNNGPVVNAELGNKVAFTFCSAGATLVLPALELPIAVEGAIDAVDIGVEIWDWTRKQ